MSYVMGQTSCPAGTATPLFTTPPGLCNVTFFNLSTAACYIGTSTNLSTVNGMQCHSIPTSFNTYVGSKAATFFGTVPSGTAIIYYAIATTS